MNEFPTIRDMTFEYQNTLMIGIQNGHPCGPSVAQLSCLWLEHKVLHKGHVTQPSVWSINWSHRLQSSLKSLLKEVPCDAAESADTTAFGSLWMTWMIKSVALSPAYAVAMQNCVWLNFFGSDIKLPLSTSELHFSQWCYGWQAVSKMLLFFLHQLQLVGVRMSMK